MAEEREEIRVSDEWWGSKNFKPSEEQKKRKKRTGSLYRRDETTEEYKYSKGKFI